jgi:cellobiose-specific phosphotransferase system component IIC
VIRYKKRKKSMERRFCSYSLILILITLNSHFSIFLREGAITFMVIFIAGIIFLLIFTILLHALNKSILKLFVPIQKLTSNFKRKQFIRGLSLIIVITICGSLANYYKLNDIYYGLLLGFFLALQNIIFENPITDKPSTK